MLKEKSEAFVIVQENHGLLKVNKWGNGKKKDSSQASGYKQSVGNRHGVQAPVPRLQSEEGLSVNPSAHAGAARKSKKPLLKSHMK